MMEGTGMIQIEESQQLMAKFIKLRAIAEETKSAKDIAKFKKHERLCVEKFEYLITMRTWKYKSYDNYEDLNQEGMEALTKAMKNYNPRRSIFFFWAHSYIATRISRAASAHTTIRYPLKIAKTNPPHKERDMPIMLDEKQVPDLQLECAQTTLSLYNTVNSLNNQQKEIINLVFGLTGDKPMSINKICKKLSISRVNCIKEIDIALSEMKEKIIL
jgi:RNA polymerase sigma factor (sigma-70 family)